MALTRAQVQLAFKRARAHFKGKIPKGTKLARFVHTGHRSSGSTRTRTSRPAHHSSSSGGVTHTHKQKAITTGVHVGAALIAFNREIGSLVRDFQSGALIQNPQVAGSNLAYAAVGLNTQTGQIDSGQLTSSLISKAGGYVFDKVAMWFLKRIKI